MNENEKTFNHAYDISELNENEDEIDRISSMNIVKNLKK